MAGQRRRLAANAFHHVAVAAEGVDVVVEQLEAGPVEVRASQRSAMAMPTLLPMPWPSGPVVVSTPLVMAVFGMAGAAAVELAEALDVVQRHGQLAQRLVFGVDGLHAGQMQQRIEQHRGVAAGEHEAVAVGPDAARPGSKRRNSLPERIGHRAPGPWACPGWPVLAACTASMDSVRMVLMES